MPPRTIKLTKDEMANVMRGKKPYLRGDRIVIGHHILKLLSIDAQKLEVVVEVPEAK